METTEKTKITISTLVKAGIEKVWNYWSQPEHITRWCHASADWHAPQAENDLRQGGRFKTTMAARDGSMSFDFEGTYTLVEQYVQIHYAIADGRKVEIDFSVQGDTIKITEIFEAEKTHPAEVQQSGWQAILDNFKKYTEEN